MCSIEIERSGRILFFILASSIFVIFIVIIILQILFRSRRNGFWYRNGNHCVFKRCKSLFVEPNSKKKNVLFRNKSFQLVLSLFQIRECLSEFVEPDGGIKVRIQWEFNYLLFQATFNQNDEVSRFHNIQMR